MRRVAMTMVFVICCTGFHAQDSTWLRVHFLHGSKPARGFRHVERKWFGGRLGGHAGVEMRADRILNFYPTSKYHVFSRRSKPNSRFGLHDSASFYSILGDVDSVKQTVVSLKISHAERLRFDSVAEKYLYECPYDYAFFGMRCGAAAYDVLSGAGIVKRYGRSRTWRRIFYPRKLRRRLEALEGRPVRVNRVPGTIRRKWERD